MNAWILMLQRAGKVRQGNCWSATHCLSHPFVIPLSLGYGDGGGRKLRSKAKVKGSGRGRPLYTSTNEGNVAGRLLIFCAYGLVITLNYRLFHRLQEGF